jgi:hypothetical protein
VNPKITSLHPQIHDWCCRCRKEKENTRMGTGKREHGSPVHGSMKHIKQEIFEPCIWRQERDGPQQESLGN